MFGLKQYVYSSMTLLPILLLPDSLLAVELSPSTEVQKNISILQESNQCSQCNLSGANLNRLDLSGANLEGADLSRAKLFLTNLSGANLRNADLREASFGGADLAEADLRGADLAGASLVGAYMSGTLLDGEMVATTPYAQDAISDIEETVYVEDTVNSKALPETEEMSIGTRRDFEETPPSLPVEEKEQQIEKQSPKIAAIENDTFAYDDVTEDTLPKQSAAAPDVKDAPAIRDVRLQEETEPEILLSDTTKKQLSSENTAVTSAQEQEIQAESQSVDESFAAKDESPASDLQSDTQEENIEIVEQTEIVEIVEEEKPIMADVDVPQEFVTSRDAPAEKVSETEVAVGGEGEILENTQVSDSEVGADENKDAAGEDVGIVQSMLNVFSSSTPEEPPTEVMSNVARLLDTKQCYGCNLSGVNLSGENLDGADLEAADLSNTVLTKVDFEGANLKGANLSGADLSEADLSEADMYKAVLTNANLTNAKLEGTLLDDVDLSGVTGYQQPLMLMEQN
ncbi:MAG: pentapeptide repeat-containing protein [Thermodesulfobacteriota bacterium]|nr:pentapeptide repeat-containing protein [Thermodesulfobacteriota bacterium]